MSRLSHRLSHRLRGQSLPGLLVLTVCLLLTTPLTRTKAARVRSGEAFAQDARPAPTPQPSPSPRPKKSAGLKKLGRSVLHFLSCNKHQQMEGQRLSRNGPQFFPKSYHANDFSIKGLVKGNWPVAVEYELEPGSTASVTFTVKDVEPFTQPLPAGNVGPSSQPTQVAGPRKLSFVIPARFGETPRAALITFRAFTDGSLGKLPADLELTAFAVGDKALAPAKTTRAGPQTITSATLREASFQSLQSLDAFRNWQAGGPNEVAIVALTVVPLAISARLGGAFVYIFFTTNSFGMWRAEYRQNVRTLGPDGRYVKGTKYVGGKTYRQTVVPFIPIFEQWKIPGGKWPPGHYKIQVYTWFSITAGGDWATRISRPPVRLD